MHGALQNIYTMTLTFEKLLRMTAPILVCVCVCVYVCMHVCMYVCMYVRTYVRMYVCTYVRYAHTYNTRTHTHTAEAMGAAILGTPTHGAQTTVSTVAHILRAAPLGQANILQSRQFMTYISK